MADKNVKAKKGFWGTIKGFFGRIGKFFRDTKSEVKKVTWPSKKQIINNALIVLAVVVIAAIVIFLLDMLFKFLILTLPQMIFRG